MLEIGGIVGIVTINFDGTVDGTFSALIITTDECYGTGTYGTVDGTNVTGIITGVVGNSE